jgi:hypothetical protein
MGPQGHAAGPPAPGTSAGAATTEDPWPAPLSALARPDDRTTQIGHDQMPFPPAGGDPATAPRHRTVNAGLLVTVGALVAIVAVLAGVLVVQNRSQGGAASPGADKASSAVTSPGGGGSTTPVSTNPAPAPDAGVPLPPGWQRVQAPGATIGVPAGWRRSPEGPSVFWRDPGSAAYLQVDRRSWTGRPYKAWVQWEREVLAKRTLADYQRIDIRQVTDTPYEAADIEFTWSGRGGIRMHGVDRRVIAGGRRYAVFVALPAAQWDTSQERVNGFLDTFSP